jgi:hypothetical protein
MNTSELLLALYLGFAFLVQALLIINFAARNWKPELERIYGWIIYALGAPSVVLGALMFVDDQPWFFVVPPFLFFIWAMFGYIVDLWRPAAWRNPPRWSIFVPYVGLFAASLLLFWGSMWYIGTIYWIGFGVMYAVQTGLNIYSHRRKAPMREGQGLPRAQMET